MSPDPSLPGQSLGTGSPSGDSAGNAEDHRAAIFSASIDAIVAMDHLGRIVDFNPAAERIFGYKRNEVMGGLMADFIIPERMRELHTRGLARFIATGEEQVMARPLSMPALRSDGSEFRAELVITRVPRSDPPVFIGFIRDVTEQRERERTLQFLFELNQSTMPLSDADEIMAESARLLAEHLGVDRCAYAQVEDESIFVITGDHARDVPSIVGRWPVRAFGEACFEMMQRNEAFVVGDTETDQRIAPPDRIAYEATNIRAVICVPLHKHGRLTAAMAVHQQRPRRWTARELDLVQTVVNRCWESLERAKTERGLRESEELHRLIVENVRDFAIMSTDPDGLITHWNPGAQALYGWTEDEAIGQPCGILFTDEDRALGLDKLELKLARESGGAADERWHRRKDGKRLYVIGAVRPVFGPHGKLLGFNKASRDITERKHLEQQLRDAHSGLEQLVRERTAELQATVADLESFSYSIAHDMRSPLRAMHQYAQILREEEATRLSSDGVRNLSRIIAAAAKLDRLIQDILTYSRLSRVELPLESVDVEPVIADTLREYPQLAPDKADIMLHSPIPPVRAHPVALAQCISNLLTNAVKFIAPGTRPHVEIRAETHDGNVRIWIEDNGIGIPTEARSRIFDIFVRMHSADRFPGTGIGLSIVRKAMERMNGSVGVESEPGKGSRFWIQLPPA